MRYIIVFYILLVGCLEVQAQKFLETLWKGTEIRKGFESLDDNKDPAMMSLTFPREGPNAYLINGGISYNFKLLKHTTSESYKLTLNPFFVVNKNTMINEEQDNYKAGLNVNLKVGNLDKQVSRSRFFTWSNTPEYVRNHADTTNSFVLTSYFSFTRNKLTDNQPSGIYFNTYRHIGCGFQYLLGVTAGGEYDNQFDAPDPGDRGNIGRVFYSTEISLRKKAGKDDVGAPIAEIVLSNKGRYDFINTTKHDEGYLPLIRAELVVYPSGSPDFTLGFSYNMGSDPIAGLPDQKFFLLSFKFKK